jgi:hypothetical protein
LPQLPQSESVSNKLVQYDSPSGTGHNTHPGPKKSEHSLQVPETQPNIHVLPHCPQFRSSVMRSVQVPSQLVKPSEHVQPPPEQIPESQKLPQAPQLIGSVSRFTQTPSHISSNGHVDGVLGALLVVAEPPWLPLLPLLLPPPLPPPARLPQLDGLPCMLVSISGHISLATSGNCKIVENA